MGRSGLLTLVFLCSIVVCGTAGAQQRPVPVTDPDTPLQLKGFRIKPPPGPDWLMAGRDDRNVVFGKRPDTRNHTFIAIAFIRELSEVPPAGADIVELVRQLKSSSHDPARHTILEQSYVQVAEPTADCVRYQVSAQDRGVPGAKGAVFPFSIFGLVCLHPASRKVVVEASFSERGEATAASVQWQREGAAFVSALAFTALD